LPENSLDKSKEKQLEKYTELNLYPYSKVYLQGIKQHTGQYWRNHFNTIGIIGMHESLVKLSWGRYNYRGRFRICHKNIKLYE